ncbi:hypothetical protein AGLY_009089 [Aphis glycines]|uniref:Uncharacterized protein n=1 Tax=Aphis glycines TaxID=307491 RepID=A0A6G0TIX0_APHGL|nr:hypothetical protein AGLY_009089 [Aphis glycines]
MTSLSKFARWYVQPYWRDDETRWWKEHGFFEVVTLLGYTEPSEIFENMVSHTDKNILAPSKIYVLTKIVRPNWYSTTFQIQIIRTMLNYSAAEPAQITVLQPSASSDQIEENDSGYVCSVCDRRERSLSNPSLGSSTAGGDLEMYIPIIIEFYNNTSVTKIVMEIGVVPYERQNRVTRFSEQREYLRQNCWGKSVLQSEPVVNKKIQMFSTFDIQPNTKSKIGGNDWLFEGKLSVKFFNLRYNYNNFYEFSITKLYKNNSMRDYVLNFQCLRYTYTNNFLKTAGNFFGLCNQGYLICNLKPPLKTIVINKIAPTINNPRSTPAHLEFILKVTSLNGFFLQNLIIITPEHKRILGGLGGPKPPKRNQTTPDVTVNFKIPHVSTVHRPKWNII